LARPLTVCRAIALQVNGVPVDYCMRYVKEVSSITGGVERRAYDCGSAAADAYCTRLGYKASRSHAAM
jgi:hypothetical protein